MNERRHGREGGNVKIKETSPTSLMKFDDTHPQRPSRKRCMKKIRLPHSYSDFVVCVVRKILHLKCYFFWGGVNRDEGNPCVMR